MFLKNENNFVSVTKDSSISLSNSRPCYEYQKKKRYAKHFFTYKILYKHNLLSVNGTSYHTVVHLFITTTKVTVTTVVANSHHLTENLSGTMHCVYHRGHLILLLTQRKQYLDVHSACFINGMTETETLSISPKVIEFVNNKTGIQMNECV